MEHPAYGRDLDSDDFVLLGFMKEQSKRRDFAEEEELLSALSELVRQTPPEMILLTGIEGYGLVF
jgi:hypothetical protein